MTDKDDPGDLSARARSAYERTIADPPEKTTTTLDPAYLAKLEQAVSSLLRVDREIFLAVRIDAMSYAEIAERTGLSVKQVRRCMARSLHEIGAFMRDRPVKRCRWWPL